MKILVTGGTGFTGKALVKRLLDDGHQVVAMDYKEGVKTQELRAWGAEVVIGTVTDRDCVKRSMVSSGMPLCGSATLRIRSSVRAMNQPCATATANSP